MNNPNNEQAPPRDGTPEKVTYERLLIMSLTQFYRIATDILSYFHYSQHYTISEITGKRRVEIWATPRNPDSKALVWVELVNDEGEYPPSLATEILRTMNDEGVEHLFLFTNNYISSSLKEVVSSPTSNIFSVDEIIEHLVSIGAKAAANAKRRKSTNVPSGKVLISNFLKRTDYKRQMVKVRTSSIPELVHAYTSHISNILDTLDEVPDMDNIPSRVKDWTKKQQFNMLPELIKIPSYHFVPKFSYVQQQLFVLVHSSIIYMGNIVEYESLDDANANRRIIEESITSLLKVDDEVLRYKFDIMRYSEKVAYRLSVVSIVIILASLIIFVALQSALR